MRVEQTPNIAERTFEFAVGVVQFCKVFDSKSGINWVLGRQLLRSGTSVGANLQEAQAAQSSADFISQCSIALKEAREAIYRLRLLEATGQSKGENVKLLAKEADEIARILGAIIVRTKGKGRPSDSPFLTFHF